MKTKLLRKIRNRFNWFYIKNGDVVLVDHKNHENILINVEYAIKLANVKTQDQLLLEIGDISIDEYLKRILIVKLLLSLGYMYSFSLIYRFSRKWWKRKEKRARFHTLITK